MVNVEIDDGTEWQFQAFHTVAANEIGRLNPTPGDEIAIKFRGEVETDAGVSYNSYRMLVLKNAQESPPATTERPPESGLEGDPADDQF